MPFPTFHILRYFLSHLFLVLGSHCRVPEPLGQCVDVVVEPGGLDLVISL